jgi:hypothetical protein
MTEAVRWLQRDAATLYRCARECPEDLLDLRRRYQDRAAALSFAARVLGCVEAPL